VRDGENGWKSGEKKIFIHARSTASAQDLHMFPTRNPISALRLGRVPLLAIFYLLAGALPAAAQGIDIAVFGGLAYPVYDERLTLRPGVPEISGVEITSAVSPVLTADGGPVFAGTMAFEFGIFGIEGRLDSIEAAIDFSGARYDLRGTAFPFQGVTATITAAPGRFEADRVSVLSVNGRLRTPGPVGLQVSGGLSYLPDLTVTGSVPLEVDAPQLPPLGFDAGLRLRATPGQSEHRWGVNGGAGLRIGGRVALIGEVRAFYFRDYELRFGTTSGPDLLDDLLAEADAVRFEPVFFNAQVGLSFRF
jgi:hypothetical protein